MKKAFLIGAGVLLLPKVALAHCPLCTAGAGALAVGAAYLGVSSVVVGVLIGAFSLALALWLAPKIKKQYVPYQKQILILAIYLGTVIPLMPLVREYRPLYLSLTGEYGTLLHNTYLINLYLLGVVLGTAVLVGAPHASMLITRIRGKRFPYQGLTVSLASLVLISVIAQVLV